MSDLTPQMARAVIRGGGLAIGPEAEDYEQDVMAYIDAWEADRKRLAVVVKAAKDVLEFWARRWELSWADEIEAHSDVKRRLRRAVAEAEDQPDHKDAAHE